MAKGKNRQQKIQDRLINKIEIPDKVTDEELVKAAVPLVANGDVDIIDLRESVRTAVTEEVTRKLTKDISTSRLDDLDELDEEEDKEESASIVIDDGDLRLLKESSMKLTQARLGLSDLAEKREAINAAMTKSANEIKEIKKEQNIYMKMIQSKYDLPEGINVDLGTGKVTKQ